MKYTVAVAGTYIRAEIWDRQSAGETRPFWDAILDAMREYNITRVLISVRSSQAVFDVEAYGLSVVMAQAAVMDGVQIALVSDSEELAISDSYVERLARQRGLRFRAIRVRGLASEWLMAG